MNNIIANALETQKELITLQKPDKYNAAGVYGIFINDQLLYIGKSVDMLHRVASHIVNFSNPESKEYNRPIYTFLRQAYAAGAAIRFDVLAYAADYHCGGFNLSLEWILNEMEQEYQWGALDEGHTLPLCYYLNDGRGGNLKNPKIDHIMTWEEWNGNN